MKKVLILVTLIWSTVAIPAIGIGLQNRIVKKPQVSGAVKEGFQVSATAEKGSIVSGAPARLRVRIRNRTKKELYLAEAGAEMDYKVSVYGDAGRDVPLTEHGKALLKSEGFMINVNLIIKPGQEREDLLEVSNMYDMRVPGDYWVVARRSVYKLDRKGVAQAESNTVHIQVLKK